MTVKKKKNQKCNRKDKNLTNMITKKKKKKDNYLKYMTAEKRQIFKKYSLFIYCYNLSYPFKASDKSFYTMETV
jgi:hypothetical protein